MKQSKAERFLRDPGRYAHHDRIFLNNPVIMQGMGLAPGLSPYIAAGALAVAGMWFGVWYARNRNCLTK